jgi:hypothetical protein
MIQPENRGLVQVAADPQEALGLVGKTWRERAEVPVHDAKLDEVIR